MWLCSTPKRSNCLTIVPNAKLKRFGYTTRKSFASDVSRLRRDYGEPGRSRLHQNYGAASRYQVSQSPWAAGDGSGRGDEMVTCVILAPALRSASILTAAPSSLFLKLTKR